MSTEQIASPRSQTHAAHCAACGSPLGAEQRYCLECGERAVPMSSVLAGSREPVAAPVTPPTPPIGPERRAGQNTTLTALAGVGVLLLAIGVGVLIGRASAGSQSAPPAQTISLAPSSGTTAPSGETESTFTGDWPSGTNGFTVQLQTLPSGTAVSAINAAKSAATTKGASAVGALKAEEFSSLTGSGYVIYSGVYHSRAAAQKALTGLKGKFPGASVKEVSNKAASSGTSGAGGGATSKGAGSSINHPAPSTVLEGLKSAKGKNYEERSKNLPDVVETG